MPPVEGGGFDSNSCPRNCSFTGRRWMTRYSARSRMVIAPPPLEHVLRERPRQLAAVEVGGAVLGRAARAFRRGRPSPAGRPRGVGRRSSRTAPGPPAVCRRIRSRISCRKACGRVQLDAVAGVLDRRLQQHAPGQACRSGDVPPPARPRPPAPRRRPARSGRAASTRTRSRPPTSSIARASPGGSPRPGTVTKWSSSARRAVPSPVDEHEAARARPCERALGDPGDERGRDAGVDGVAAVRQHLRARLGGERMARCDCATHPSRLLGVGRYPRLAAVTRTSVQREATLAAGAAASLAAALVWLGPPGSDLAEHAYQRTLFLNDGFALWNNFWYAGRYSFVTYSTLYYPLAALFGIRLLAVATVSTAALAFAVDRLAAVGPDRALVEPDVRGRLGRDRVLGRVPVRARRGARAARDLGAPGAALLALRRARGADAGGEPARLPAARRSCSPASGSRAGRSGAPCSRPR